MTWAPDYSDAEGLRHYLRVPEPEEPDEDVDEAEMALAVTAASRAIDLTCNRQFGSVTPAEDRYYRPYWDRELRRYVVDIDDLMDATGLIVASSVIDANTYDTTVTGYALRPMNAASDLRPWTRLVFASGTSLDLKDLRVTALWGWSAVPDPIVQATLLQASRLFKRRDAPFGVAGSPDTGSEIRLLARVDPDVAVVLRPYVRWWGAV